MQQLLLLRILLLVCVISVVSVGNKICGQSKAMTRKIIDVHFHALEWNSFGNPPPPNEITGVAPRQRSDSEEQSIMLSCIKKKQRR
jgi:hypothetical protein